MKTNMTTAIPCHDESLSNPSISVIMPAFNAAHTIVSAINSVLAQSFASFEVLVGDDGSTDGTGERVMAIDDPRVKLFRHNKNVGTGTTRNQLIANARGAWITFCDADDKWDPTRLSILLDVALTNADAIIFDDIMQCVHTNQGALPWRRMRGPHSFGARGKPVRLSTTQLIDSPRMLIKPFFSKALLCKSGATHSTHPYAEDSAFLLKILTHAGVLIYVPYALYLYRLTPISASSHPRRLEMLREVLENAIQNFVNNPEVQIALVRKIARVQRDILYARLVTAIKDHNIPSVFNLVTRHPWMLGKFMRRAFADVSYNLHRLLRGGSSSKEA